jgi:hypothetical protein
VEVEISPEPTEEERTAILAVLAQDAETVPVSWEERDPEP